MMNCTFVDFLFVFFFSLDFNFDDFLCQTRDVLSVFVLFYCFSTVSPLGSNLSLSFECKCKQQMFGVNKQEVVSVYSLFFCNNNSNSLVPYQKVAQLCCIDKSTESVFWRQKQCSANRSKQQEEIAGSLTGVTVAVTSSVSCCVHVRSKQRCFFHLFLDWPSTFNKMISLDMLLYFKLQSEPKSTC